MNILSILDHINPLLLFDKLRSMARYGVGVRFVVASATAVQIALRTLKRYGIRTYGYTFMLGNSEERGFRVRKEQAQWAEYLLLRAGVPLVERPHHPANANVQPDGAMPQAWSKTKPKASAPSVGFAGAVLDLLDKF